MLAKKKNLAVAVIGLLFSSFAFSDTIQCPEQSGLNLRGDNAKLWNFTAKGRVCDEPNDGNGCLWHVWENSFTPPQDLEGVSLNSMEFKFNQGQVNLVGNEIHLICAETKFDAFYSHYLTGWRKREVILKGKITAERTLNRSEYTSCKENEAAASFECVK